MFSYALSDFVTGSSLKCYLCAAVIDSGDACEELNTDYMVINEFAGDNAACVKFESETNGEYY